MENLVNFLSVPIIRQLLILDVTFYGLGIADIIAGKHSFQSKGTLQAFSPTRTSCYVQRLLKENNAEKRLITTSFNQFMCVYYVPQINVDIEFRFDDRIIQLCIPKPLTDVSRILIDRRGMTVLSQNDDCCPFVELMQKCIQSKCSVDPSNTMSGKIIDDIKNLYRNGWIVDNLKIQLVMLQTPQDCPICHESIDGEVLQTSCHHYFCTDCWEKHYNHSVGDTINTLFSFNMENDPKYVTCPMCRFEMKPWECVPIRTKYQED